MKKQLIDKLFDEFESEKEEIKNNLCNNMDIIVLQTNDDYGNVKLIITYERDDELWQD